MPSRRAPGRRRAPTRWAGSGRWRRCSAAPVRAARAPAKTGCRCIGFQIGRVSMPASRQVRRRARGAASRRRRVDDDRRQPAVVLRVVGTAEDRAPRPSRRTASRSARAAPPAADHLVEPAQLGAAQRGQHVAQPVVVADLGVLVVGDRLRGPAWTGSGTWAARSPSSVSSIPPPEVVMILLPLNDSTAASPNDPAGRPPYVRAEATPRRRSSTGTPYRVATARDRVVVGALAEQVDRHAPRRPARPSRCSSRERLGQQVRARCCRSPGRSRRRPASRRCSGWRSRWPRRSGSGRGTTSPGPTPQRRPAPGAARPCPRRAPPRARHPDPLARPRARRRRGRDRRAPPSPSAWRVRT